MKTLVCLNPEVFEYQEREAPPSLSGRSILQVKRIGICGTDLHAFEGTQPYFDYPRVLGHELSGDLVEGENISDIKTGDKITIMPYFHCGTCVACRHGITNCCVNMKVCGVHIDGGMTEYLSVPNYALIPGEGLSYEELALVEPLAIGAHAIRRARVTEGENVLVMGAGPIGLGVMEYAKLSGGKVIALDLNEGRLRFCRNFLKVDYTINGAEVDVAEALREITNGDFPTVVIDATGSGRAIAAGFSYLAHGGRYILVGLQKGDISFSHPEFHKREATLMSSRNATREDFETVIQSLKTGKVKALNYITHRVEFSEVKDTFSQWLNPANGVIKAMVSVG